MPTKNDASKPETELKQEAGEGCSGATCSASLDDAIAIAKGCLDYGGGYRRDEGLLEAFHDGIQTVVNALTAAKKSAETGANDTQVNALRRMGNSPPNTKDQSSGTD